MPGLETNRSAIVRRLEADGWRNLGGAKHDKFEKPDVDHAIIVPRHSTLSPGVAGNIMKAAGW